MSDLKPNLHVMGHLHNCTAQTLCLLTQYQAIHMQVIHTQRWKHKGMMRNLFMQLAERHLVVKKSAVPA